MKTSNIIEGLTILQKYRDKDAHDCGADHDVIYAYPTTRPVEQPDLDRVIELGWRQDVRTQEDEDFNASYYDPEESWWGWV